VPTSPPDFLPLDPRSLGLAEPLCADVDLLNRLLGEVLAEQDAAGSVRRARELFSDAGGGRDLVERYPELADPAAVERVLRAYTVFFQLLNTAEQKEIIRVNRERQARSPERPRSESIREAVLRLRDAGVTADEMAALLDRIYICPTLTAHPTEARRRAVLDKLQSIARNLAERAEPEAVPRLDRPLSASTPDADLRRTLPELWQTDELRASPITVEDEVRNGLYFFERTILEVVPWLHADLRTALEEAYPGSSLCGPTFSTPSFLEYRSWIGGDRDGNPNVTPDITWRTSTTRSESRRCGRS
jgi:phosphoenolpyruvate carboxylase